MIVRAYERLWRELGELRSANDSASPPAPQTSSGFWPARPDPFELFASFPSAVLSARHKAVQAPDVDQAEVEARLSLKMAMVGASSEISAAFLVDLWKQVGSEALTVAELLELRKDIAPPLTVRALLGLVRIAGPDKAA